MADLVALTEAVEAGNRSAALALTRALIDDGVAAATILDAMTTAMTAVGGRYQRAEIFVPEMLISARAMQEAMVLLEPRLVAADIRSEATAVIGTVKGDLHSIGKNLVGMMWKGANIRVVDLGTDVSPERFVAAAREHGARLVGLSALLTTTMLGMRDVVGAVRASGLDDVKVIVGGAPVTAEFAREIGADGYAPDAASAVDIAHSILRPEGR
jgi:5-methyltetrahydrofolate--homocysteine methyltransferase